MQRAGASVQIERLGHEGAVWIVSNVALKICVCLFCKSRRIRSAVILGMMWLGCELAGQRAGDGKWGNGFPSCCAREARMLKPNNLGYRMFKFLFGKKTNAVVVETQRETVKRAVDELNAVLALMADKPKVSLDLNSGLLAVELPEQMPDEALALPAPEKASEGPVETANDASKDVAAEDVEEAVDEAAAKAEKAA